MDVTEIKSYCLSKHKATETYPFGDIPICYKLNGKIFAQIYPKADDYKITLKCTLNSGQFYRMLYPGKVMRGYHCPPVQQPYWNTVYLDDFPDDELLNMIDHAYDTVLHSFSKKVQKQIAEDERYQMGIIYTEQKKFSEDDLKNLFASVHWLSANYSNRLKKALDHCETVITAWDGSQLVGLVNAIDDSELTAYVHYLCVNPAYQGKGIGRQLLNRIKEKYQNYLYIILIAENEQLIQYYSQNGFDYIDGRFVFAIQND